MTVAEVMELLRHKTVITETDSGGTVFRTKYVLADTRTVVCTDYIKRPGEDNFHTEDVDKVYRLTVADAAVSIKRELADGGRLYKGRK